MTTVSSAPTTSALLPDPRARVDLAMTLTLGAVALYGFHDTFAGWTYLAAGALGLLLGGLMAYLAYALRQPFIVTAVLTIVAFFLLGGAIALHGDGASAALPLPDTLVSLADQGVHGWKELLTTLPPIDGGPLLTLPYLLGLVAGAGGGAAALRLRSAWIPVLAPIALFAAVILLGTQAATDVVALGAVFAVLAVCWLVLRARRLRRTTHFARRRLRQRVTALALVVAATALAVLVGPHLPGTPDDRFVLRSKVQPPFDIGKYPSLLASFRKFRPSPNPNITNLNDKPLFTVTGLKPGTLLRFTTLNAYDGTVWGAANIPSGVLGDDDTYQKVGTRIDNPLQGPSTGTVTVKIESDGLGVWMPTYGGLTAIDFDSARLKAREDHFRYNIAAQAGVMPDGLRAGDTYTFRAAVPAATTPTAKSLPAGEPLVTSTAASQFQPQAIAWAGAADTPMARVLAVAARLRSDGAYTDGDGEFAVYHAGHSLARLKQFLSPDVEPVGNDEQFAATMALMANDLGVPARVVVGAPVPASGPVMGRSVQAWVELRTDHGWQTLPTSSFMDKNHKPDQTQSQKNPQLSPGITVPPPVPVRPPSTVGDAVSDSTTRRGTADDEGFKIPGIVFTLLEWIGVPALLLLAVVLAITAAKRRRRTRRRTGGSPARRIELAYRDLLDAARDLGHRVSSRDTRREQATAIGVNGFVALARSADAGTFGPHDPTEETAARYWVEVDLMRSELVSGLGFWKRFRAATNLTSFTPLRPRGVAE